MKNKIINIILLFFLILLALFYVFNLNKPQTFRIIKVVEADEFYLDFNFNQIPEENEHVKLAQISAFYPEINSYTIKQAQNLGIKPLDFARVGYLARRWANDKLYRHEVMVFGLENCKKDVVCKVDVFFEGKDLSKTLVDNGLAYVQDGAVNRKYYEVYDLNKVKNNSNALSKVDFVFYDLKNKIVHNLDCKFADLNKTELLLKDEAKYLNLKSCPYCKNEKAHYDILKNSKKYSNPIFKTSFGVDLYLINPTIQKRPSSICNNEFCKRLIQEINQAKNTIDIALYGFGNQKEIFNALKMAKKRGVKIRVVADKSKKQDFMFSSTSDLLREFPSKTDYNSSLMHNKFIIFDDKTVFTGSINISSSGSGGYNANNAIFIKNEKIAKMYQAEFEQMFSGKFSTNKLKAPKFNTDKIEVYFSPQDNVLENVFLSNIKKAKKSIYVSIFYLTHRDLIEELILAKKRGINVMILIDSTGASNFRQRITDLRSLGIPVAIENWGGKNHEKTIVIDGKTLILGSSNFSKSGFNKNDENIVVINDDELAKKYEDYFLYLFNSIDKKYLHSIPRAEGVESINSCFDGLDNDYDGKIDNFDTACKNVK
ncbi:MAG: DUF1669 domain-containing protein [Candidatus Gastranaerophilales bacterium]|nr:DUF1669 domain-containing protein [Candidatus Gastranaerophilales bacterium]